MNWKNKISKNPNLKIKFCTSFLQSNIYNFLNMFEFFILKIDVDWTSMIKSTCKKIL